FEHLSPGPYRISISRSGGLFGGVVVDAEAMAEEAAVAEEGAAPDEEIAPDDVGAEEEPADFGPPLISRPATVVAGRMTVLDLTRAEGATIEGSVLAGGKPVGSGWTFVMSGDNFADQRGMMEFENGKFRIENLEPGHYRVIAAADQGGSGQAELEIREGDRVVTLEVRLGTGKVSGQVLNHEGKPVVGAGVLVVRTGRNPSPTRDIADLIETVLGQADTAGKGRFEIEGVAPGRYRILCGFKGKLLTRELTLREGEQAGVDFRFDPQRLHRLTIRLKDHNGEPIAGHVALMGADGGLAETIALSSGDEEDMMMGPLEPTHQYDLAPGTYRISASAEGLAKVLGREVVLNADREVVIRITKGVDVRLRLNGPSGPLAGTDLEVRSEEGFPVGAASSLFEVIFQPKSLRTDAHGVVALPPLPRGRYTVHLDDREVGSFRVGDRPVEKTIEVTR
ncbi:MAG: MSCRAMM family protein, partial [Planctomycetota bacterium]